MPIGIGNDALASYAFHVEIDGLAKAQFKSVEGLSSEITVIEHQEMGNGGKLVQTKAPGKVKWSDIKCTQGVTPEMADLWKWHEDAKKDIDSARKGGSIVVFDYSGGEKLRFNFTDGWCSRLNITGLDATQSGEKIAYVEMTIAHTGLTRG